MDTLDTQIAEATAQVATEQKASEEEAKTQISQTQEQVTEAPKAEQAEDVSKLPDDALTADQLAKREKNRQSHQNSKLAAMRREIRELKAQQSKPAQSVETPKAETVNTKPNIKDFNNWEDYNEALIADAINKLSAKDNKATQTTDKESTVTQDLVTRELEIRHQVEDFKKTAPDYAELYKANAGFFNKLPTDIATALAEADNPPLALYALMKEDALYDLDDLSPTKLAAELARAEIRGQSYLKAPKTVTETPAPLAAAKGNSTGGKPLEKQSYKELMKSLGL